MSYTPEDSAKLQLESLKILSDLQMLMGECIRQGREAANPRVQEYMHFGVGRRVMVLLRSVENIFALFPPSQERPLKHEELSDVQINLHAFIINIYGIWDNWAWAFVHLHDLEAEMGGHHNVGLFKKKTQNFLPSALKDYLQSESTSKWHQTYLKSYRDALAHRIPLYVPPSELNQREWEEYQQLEDEKIKCLKSADWVRLEEVWSDQDNIGRPSFQFLTAFSQEEGLSSLALHSQLLCDSMLIVEFGNLFLGAWQERGFPTEPAKDGWR